MLAIHIVFEVENAGESGAGGVVFGPGTVFVLVRGDIRYRAEWSRGSGRAGAEAHNGPGGLAGSAGTATFERREVVGFACFTPAAVVVLATRASRSRGGSIPAPCFRR